MITVFIEERKQEEKIPYTEGMTVKQAMAACKVNPVEVIPVINNTLVLESQVLQKGDRLECLSVISGG